jgi:predicted AAA+ superfamily ATPase
MDYPLEEKIGLKELFTNREEDLAYFEAWIDDIDQKAAISTAIVSHRKVGKTAILQRLFNLFFTQQEKVIPFLFEVREQDFSIDDLSHLYYSRFLSQLLSFKTKKWPGHLLPPDELLKLSRKMKLDYVAEDIRIWQKWAKQGGSSLWTYTNEAPHRLAEASSDRILVMIDEFQYLNKYIYTKMPFTPENHIRLAGSYLGTSESRIAPMLITGSAVGMLVQIIFKQLPKRFKFYRLEKFKPQDFLELGYKLSNIYNVPATDECLLLAHRLLDGHPAYLRDIFDSRHKEKDLTTTAGLYETYLFEVGDHLHGRIRAGWEEYIDLAFDEINEFNARKIVLFLAKHNDREWSRMEIKEKCGLHEMTDRELERKLQALVYGDLIAYGHSSLYYQGLGDPTFEKVFRLKYEEEIEQIDFDLIKQDMIADFEQKYQKMKQELAAKTTEANRLRGELNQKKGEIGEFWIKSILRSFSAKQRYFAPGELGTNTEKMRLPRFRKIEKYSFVSNGREIALDVLCEPVQADEWYLAVEVKNREAQKTHVAEVENFAAALAALRKHKAGVQLRGMVYSFNGFQPAAAKKLRELEIFYWNFETLNELS